MLLALMLLAATGATDADRGRYAACMVQVESDPAAAIATAQAWRVENGGVGALHCLALGQMARRDYAAAFASYDSAVRASRAAGDGQAIVLLAQAADAALIASQPETALKFIDQGLAGDDAAAAISPLVEAALRRTRAEALVDLKREKDAVADLAQATSLAPGDATGWLLRATLARRMADMALAETAILKAAETAPDSAEVQYEAGTIAAAKGDMELARTAWKAAAAGDPESVAGKAAAAALEKATVVPKGEQ